MTEKLNLGIIGAGWMADMAAEEIQKIDDIVLAGVCARHADKAESFAKKYGIPFAADCVDALLDRKDISAVYIATLNSSHCELAKRAMRAGKAVIVEKPFAMNAKEAEEMVGVARETGCMLMEAMWTRFFPSILYVRQLIGAGVIGTLQKVEICNSMKMDRTANARVFCRETGGGVLLDIGVYALNLLQMLTGRLPASTENKIIFSDTGVDISDEILYRYEDGLKARVMVSGQEDQISAVALEGTAGRIDFDKGLMGGSFVLRSKAEEQYYNLGNERFRYPYYYQFEHFAKCIRQGRRESYVMPLADTLQVMQMMDEARYQGGFFYPGESF